jgi:hypothetical protein
MSSDDYLNSKIGEEYKTKLREIAEKKERDMTKQLRSMITEKYQEVVQ